MKFTVMKIGENNISIIDVKKNSFLYNTSSTNDFCFIIKKKKIIPNYSELKMSRMWQQIGITKSTI